MNIPINSHKEVETKTDSVFGKDSKLPIQEKAEKLAKISIDFSTKISAMISMLDTYMTAYKQNQIDFIKICSDETMSLALTVEQKAQVNRVTKNKLNKLENVDIKTQSFFKVIRKEFVTTTGTTQLDDFLLDTFDKFWSEHVIVTENEVKIKQ